MLDLDFVRRQFPAFGEPSLQGQAFFENAGGSYACAPVISRLNEYYRRLKVQDRRRRTGGRRPSLLCRKAASPSRLRGTSADRGAWLAMATSMLYGSWKRWVLTQRAAP